MKIILALCFCAVAVLGAPSIKEPKIAAIRALPALQHEEVHDDFNQYALRYVTAEGIEVSERGRLVPTADGKDHVMIYEGEYSFIGDDGKRYTTKYTTDANGVFSVVGDHLPVAPEPLPVKEPEMPKAPEPVAPKLLPAEIPKPPVLPLVVSRAPLIPAEVVALRALPALQHEEVHDDLNQHSLRYVTAEGMIVSQRGRLVPTADGKDHVMIFDGEYSFIGDDGKRYTTKYTTDVNGVYSVVGDHLPVAPEPLPLKEPEMPKAPVVSPLEHSKP